MGQLTKLDIQKDLKRREQVSRNLLASIDALRNSGPKRPLSRWCREHFRDLQYLDDADRAALDFRENKTIAGFLGVQLRADGSLQTVGGGDLELAKSRFQHILLRKLLPMYWASSLGADLWPNWQSSPAELIQADPAKYLAILGVQAFKDGARNRFGPVNEHILDGVIVELENNNIFRRQLVPYHSPWSHRNEKSAVVWPGSEFLTGLPAGMAAYLQGASSAGSTNIAPPTTHTIKPGRKTLESVKSLRQRAEEYVKRRSNVFPGVRPLARSLKCPESSLHKAIKGSSYLKARQKEHEHQKGGKLEYSPLTEVHTDSITQRTEPDPAQSLEELVAEQEADRRNDERRRRERLRTRSQ